MESYRVVFSPEAEAQLVAIYRWSAERATPTIAEGFTRAIIDYCEKLDALRAREFLPDGPPQDPPSAPDPGTFDELRPSARTCRG